MSQERVRISMDHGVAEVNVGCGRVEARFHPQRFACLRKTFKLAP